MPSSHHTDTCIWCGASLTAGAKRQHARTCSKLCRQRLWRFHVRPIARTRQGPPRHFAYADPPYPGKASLYPEHQEVDHARLIAQLQATYPDGWALSTAAQSLRDILPLCPPGTRVCAWFKGARPHKHARVTTAWEPLLVWTPGYRRHPSRPGTHDALIARGKFRAHPNYMIGSKPPAYATWLFQLLDAASGDTLDDLFPGSGAVTRAWNLYTLPDPRDTVPREATPCLSTTATMPPSGDSSRTGSGSTGPTNDASAADNAGYTAENAVSRPTTGPHATPRA